MIYVTHKKNVPESWWFKFDSSNTSRYVQGSWCVIMNNEIYSVHAYENDANSKADELVRYFS